MTDKAPISERALAFLVENGCMPPGWSRSALLDWLSQHGAPRCDVLVAWEEALHEIRERFYLPNSPCASNAKGCREGYSNYLLLLPDGFRCWTMRIHGGGRIPTVREHEGAKLVLFAENSGRASYFYMDEAGCVFEVGPPNLSCRLSARSPFIQLERAILRVMSQRAPAYLIGEGDIAAKLAEALSVPLIPEASDDIEQVWGDARFLFFRRGPSSVEMFVRKLMSASLLVGALKELSGRAFLHGATPPITYEPLLAAPPLTAPPSGRAVPLWSFGGVRGFIYVEADALVQVTGRDTEVRRRVIEEESRTETRRCLLTDADLRDFSPRARAYLLAANVRRDPVVVPHGDELEDMLARWGLRPYDALLCANTMWGGFAWGGEPSNQLGTFGILLDHFPPPDPPLGMRKPGSPRDLGLDWEGRELVIIGATPSTTMYLDHDGSVIEHEAYENQLFPSAGSLVRRVEFEAALETVTGAMGQYFEGACAGSVGTELARALGIPRAAEASDAIRAWWIGEHVSINELYSPMSAERITAIFADSEEQLEQAIRLGESLSRG